MCKSCRKKISSLKDHVCTVLVKIPRQQVKQEDSSYMIPENLQDLALISQLPDKVPDDDILPSPSVDPFSIDFVIEVCL